MPFAPVRTNGFLNIRVEAEPHIIEHLKELKLVEERDGGYYLRRCRNYRKKLSEIIKQYKLCITTKDGFLTYIFRDNEDAIEKFLEDLDREIMEIEALLG